MTNRLLLYLPVLMALLVTLSAQGQTFNTTGTTNVVVNVQPEAALAVNTSTTTLSTTGTVFNPFTGTTNLIYKIRTSKTGGQAPLLRL